MKNIISWLLPRWLFYGLAFDDSSSSSTSTNQFDQRVTNGAGTVAQGGSTVINADAAAINDQNTKLLAGISSDLNDSAKTIVQIGGNAAHDLVTTAGLAASNSSKAWEHTVDVAGQLLMDQNATAKQAIASFEPSANKISDSLKAVAIAVAIGLGVFAFAKGK